MNVKDIMNSKVTVVRSETTLKEASEIMAREEIGFLAIGSGSEISGVVTDRDIVRRGLAKNGNPDTTTVGEVASQKLHYCEQDHQIDHAVDTMVQNKVRRLPVLNSERSLVGVVSLGDLAQHVGSQKVGELLSAITR